MSWREASELTRAYINPDYVALLKAFDYGRWFARAKGTELFDEQGTRYLDFLAGFGVHNLGHNPAPVVEALQGALAADGASMLNMDVSLAAGRLAERLTALTHPDLCRTVFANSGAEAVDLAIRAARAATGRIPVVACDNGFHGFSAGAISLMGNATIRSLYGPLLPEVLHIPFGSVDALRAVCRDRKPAAFVVEPIQAEGGVAIPSAEYLCDAAAVCREYGCLLAIDEIQTGLGRTGRFFATDFDRTVPDILLVGKALGAGLVPVSAAIMKAETWSRAFSGPDRCLLDSPTCAGGLLAMTAAWATLDTLEKRQLPGAALNRGRTLMEGLRRLAQEHRIVKEVRGAGLLIGVEFAEPGGVLIKAVPHRVRDGLYAQVVCARLLRDHRIVAQPCALKRTVLRVEPPLIVDDADLEFFLAALDATLSDCPSHGSAAFGAARKTILGGRL